MLHEIDLQMLLKISSTSVTQNWSHKRYSKLVSQTFLEIDPQTLTYKRYSKLVPQVLLEIDPQMLVRISSTSVTQN